MKCVLLGFGQIGEAIHKVYGEFHTIYVHDPLKSIEVEEAGDIDVLLVTIPYSPEFISIVKAYQKRFKPNATIVFSTTAIGTVRQLDNAVHCPIEGRHPDLERSIKVWDVYMGGYSDIAYKFFTESGKAPIKLVIPDHTEFLKLQSTTNYGLMIEYARYVSEVCNKIEMYYGNVQDYNKSYNDLYASKEFSNIGVTNINEHDIKRYILTPPKGKIGGHCILPNIDILNKQYPSELLAYIQNVNNAI